MRKEMAISLIVVVILVILLLKPVNVIVVENHHDQEILLWEKIEPGFVFATLIKHSVHLTPVYEYYLVESDGNMMLSGTKFVDLGWGVPSTYKYETIFEDGMLELKEMNISIDWLPFRVTEFNQSKLILNREQSIDLNDYFDNNERMDIRIERVPKIKYWIRGETNVFY